MNDNRRGLIALLIVFLALLIMGVIEAIFAATPKNLPHDEILRQEVNAALKYHDGIVLLWERPGGNRHTFGNPKLLHEKFLPGSLMKLITAQAALNQGLDSSFTCNGKLESLSDREYCWTPQGHGPLHLVQALSQSCNLYFFHLGQQLGWSSLSKALEKGGLPIPAGFSPQGFALGRAAIGEAQELSFSPQQLASYWETLLAQGPGGRDQNLFKGLELAAQSGTASGLKSLGLPVWAKTGTADSQISAYKTHGWILAAAPAPKPRWALLIFMKNAHGYGAPTALAAKIFSELKRMGHLEEPH